MERGVLATAVFARQDTMQGIEACDSTFSPQASTSLPQYSHDRSRAAAVNNMPGVHSNGPNCTTANNSKEQEVVGPGGPPKEAGLCVLPSETREIATEDEENESHEGSANYLATHRSEIKHVHSNVARTACKAADLSPTALAQVRVARTAAEQRERERLGDFILAVTLAGPEPGSDSPFVPIHWGVDGRPELSKRQRARLLRAMKQSECHHEEGTKYRSHVPDKY